MSVHLLKLASQSKLSIKSPLPSSVTYSLAQLLLMRSTFSPDPESLTAPGNLPCTFHVFFVNNHTPTHESHTDAPHEIIHCVSRLQLSSHLHAETLLCLTRLVSKLDFFACLSSSSHTVAQLVFRRVSRFFKLSSLHSMEDLLFRGPAQYPTRTHTRVRQKQCTLNHDTCCLRKS